MIRFTTAAVAIWFFEGLDPRVLDRRGRLTPDWSMFHADQHSEATRCIDFAYGMLTFGE